MVDELNELARWTIYLIRANHDFREHACEFSKFLAQNVPEDDWPDVAEQLIRLLDDVEYMSSVCVPLARSFSAHLATSVAGLNLPKPAEHISWTLWIVEHWMHVEGLLKLRLGCMVSVPPTNPKNWFHQLAMQARLEPDKCRDISRLLFEYAEKFVAFDDQKSLIESVKRECLGVHSLMNLSDPSGLAEDAIGQVKPEELNLENAALYANDRPIRWIDIEELCVGKFNRVGKIVAGSDSTVRNWRYSNDWPNPMTWQSVRKWVNDKKSYDFKDPPDEC